MLTLDCGNDTVPIFDQLFEKFARPVQLQFITLEGLSEVWTVLVALTELQRRVPHLRDELLSHNRRWKLWKHAASAFLWNTAHFSSAEETMNSLLLTGAQTMVSGGACGCRWRAAEGREQ